MKYLITLLFVGGCSSPKFVASLPPDAAHYSKVVLTPNNGKKVYSTLMYNVYYLPEKHLWLNSKRKPLLRGLYQGAEVFELKKVKP